MCDFFDDDNFGNGRDDDDEYPSICDRMRKMAEEAARRKILGLPEEKKPEEPSPTAKSPRKRANFFSDLVDQIVKAEVLLVTEDGEPFAYDEKLGYYQPCPS